MFFVILIALIIFIMFCLSGKDQENKPHVNKQHNTKPNRNPPLLPNEKGLYYDSRFFFPTEHQVTEMIEKLMMEIFEEGMEEVGEYLKSQLEPTVIDNLGKDFFEHYRLGYCLSYFMMGFDVGILKLKTPGGKAPRQDIDEIVALKHRIYNKMRSETLNAGVSLKDNEKLYQGLKKMYTLGLSCPSERLNPFLSKLDISSQNKISESGALNFENKESFSSQEEPMISSTTNEVSFVTGLKYKNQRPVTPALVDIMERGFLTSLEILDISLSQKIDINIIEIVTAHKTFMDIYAGGYCKAFYIMGFDHGLQKLEHISPTEDAIRAFEELKNQLTHNLDLDLKKYFQLSEDIKSHFAASMISMYNAGLKDGSHPYNMMYIPQ